MYTASSERYDTMVYNRCGKSGLLLPAVSLGLWHNFGTNADPENMKAMLRTAFDLGITHFDLANNYGPEYGSAETNFGKILKEDFEMIYAMVGSNDILWETMDVFETWVYRTSMSGTYSAPAAMSLLQNIVTFFLVWGANTWARRRDQASVW